MQSSHHHSATIVLLSISKKTITETTTQHICLGTMLGLCNGKLQYRLKNIIICPVHHQNTKRQPYTHRVLLWHICTLFVFFIVFKTLKLGEFWLFCHFLPHFGIRFVFLLKKATSVKSIAKSRLKNKKATKKTTTFLQSFLLFIIRRAGFMGLRAAFLFLFVLLIFPNQSFRVRKIELYRFFRVYKQI